MRGGGLPALQQVLGHATLAMTMRYSHVSPKHLRDEVKRTEAKAAAIARGQHTVVESASLRA
jgi:site-specific recombinase XerD